MLTSLALIFLGGVFSGMLFKKFKMPGIIGMIFAGIILGPFALNLLDDSILAISADLRQLALIIILIRTGLSLNTYDLKKIGRPALLMSIIPAVFEMLGTILIAAKLFNIPVLDAAILAAVLASVSPAVITPRMLNLIEQGYGTNKNIPQLILAGNTVNSIINIVVFTSLISVSKGEKLSFARLLFVLPSAALGILLGVFAGFLFVRLFKKFEINDYTKIIIILSIAFLFIAAEKAAENILPFSGLLPIITMGIVILRKMPLAAKNLSDKFSKMWGWAEILLFVLVGAGVNIKYAGAAGFKTIALLAAVLLMRAAGILLCLIKTNLSCKERLFCTFTGIPKATVQAAIGGIPLAMGLSNGDIILAAAVISILFTAPLGAFIIDRTYKRLLTKEETTEKAAV